MPSGHTYAPVQGVGFADLCAVTADVARQSMQTGQPPAPGTNPYVGAAAGRGFDASTWMLAQLVWGCRAMLDPDLGIEQGREISKLIMPNMPDYSGMMPQMQMPRPDPVDPNDPRLAPIDGVTIEAYVRMVATQMTAPHYTPEQFADVAGQLGFPPERWINVMEQWGNRVMAGPPPSIRYAQLVCQLFP